jgi:histidinol-phosphate aminotransferase
MVTKVLTDFDTSSLRLYPDPENRAIVAAYAKAVGLDENEVFAGNGSDEVLGFIFQAFFSDSGVAFPDISYGFYPVYAELFGLDAEIIPLDKDYKIDIEAFKRTKKPIVIANPNAPTGIALTLKEIEELVASNLNRLVVIDEAYVDFGGESCVSLIKKYDNLIVVHTFSKSRNLAGARIGFALGASGLIEDIKKIKFSFNSYNVNRLSEEIGVAALSDPDYFETCVKEIIVNRETTVKALEKLDFTVLPSSANFIFAGNKKISGKNLYLTLKSRGILVRYFSKERLTDFVRITIGSVEMCAALIAAVSEIK